MPCAYSRVSVHVLGKIWIFDNYLKNGKPRAIIIMQIRIIYGTIQPRNTKIMATQLSHENVLLFWELDWEHLRTVWMQAKCVAMIASFVFSNMNCWEARTGTVFYIFGMNLHRRRICDVAFWLLTCICIVLYLLLSRCSIHTQISNREIKLRLNLALDAIEHSL